jgi:hypothetical protein
MVDAVPFRRADGAEIFDCIDCGCSIVRIIATGAPPRCAHCLWLPGWHKHAELRRMFGFGDPGGSPDA